MQEDKKFDVVGFVLDYEVGALNDEDTIAGFQHLINTGMVWNLQGSYGRLAKQLIEAGQCTVAV